MIFGEKSSQNRSGERLRTAPARKNDKSRFRRRLRTHCFVPGLVFGRFWAPGRTSKIAKKPTLAPMTRLLFAPATRFFTFSSLAFRKGPGPIPEAPGSLLDQILQRFCDISLPVSPGSWRGLSGCAGMLPGYTASLRNSLCGVSLGYGDLAERIK